MVIFAAYQIALMKTNIFKFYLLAFCLISDFAVFAVPGSDTGNGDLEGDDPAAPAAPINTKLIWLALVGILFAVYTFRKQKKTV